MKNICLIIVLSLPIYQLALAQRNNKKENIVYKYKKYEKFNLEEISVDGETGVPGDISIINRFKRKFDNKLPYRKNFRPELILSIERIQ